MGSWGLTGATAVVATAIVFFLSGMALPTPSMAAVVEHTFVVSQVKMTRLCKETLVTVVNGQLPGPTIEVTEGDSVVIHVVNNSPYNITIHWHGVKQRQNCWMDGVPMVTQCPILPNRNFTYRFTVAGQEGTLWWHAHVACLRGTLHGALVIRPRHGYPFPKPDKEIAIVIGTWMDADLVKVDEHMKNGEFDDSPSASTINGKLGHLYNCSGAVQDGFVLNVEPGKTYLLRVINAALFSEFYLKIAGHKMTVVASDANYVKPFTTDTVAIAPGETMDVLLVADAPPGRRSHRYAMVALAIQPPKVQAPWGITSGTVQYSNNVDEEEDSTAGSDAVVVPVTMPDMPDEHDTTVSFYFHGNLTSLRRRHQRRAVPARSDEHMYITLGLGYTNGSTLVATMNDVSFRQPASAAAPLLEALRYHRGGGMAAAAGTELHTLPDRPQVVYNFTDPFFAPLAPRDAPPLEPTPKQTAVRRFRHGAAVELVLQGTAMMQSDSNPMHLHGHDMFVLAQGLGNYDAAGDAARYNLVDPPEKNTVVVPRLGWVAVRFVADNPGAWFFHCHFEFHLSSGMVAVFIVEDGSSVHNSLPPPPADLPKCQGTG